jgi:hypothetical protein
VDDLVDTFLEAGFEGREVGGRHGGRTADEDRETDCGSVGHGLFLFGVGLPEL